VDPGNVRLYVHHRHRKDRVHIPQGPNGNGCAVRLSRMHRFGDACQRDRVTKNSPARLVVRMAPSSSPCLTPGEQAIGANIRDHPRDPRRGIVCGFQACIREVQKASFHVQDRTRLGTLLGSEPGDFIHG